MGAAASGVLSPHHPINQEQVIGLIEERLPPPPFSCPHAVLK